MKTEKEFLDLRDKRIEQLKSVAIMRDNYDMTMLSMRGTKGDIYITQNVMWNAYLDFHKENPNKKFIFRFNLNGNFTEIGEDPVFFKKIIDDKLSIEEFFAIDNNDTRSIAYMLMDKSKFSEQPHIVLDSTIDDKENEMKVVQMDIPSLGGKINYLVVICPTTKKVHYLATSETNCIEAKLASFGLYGKNVKFIDEF